MAERTKRSIPDGTPPSTSDSFAPTPEHGVRKTSTSPTYDSNSGNSRTTSDAHHHHHHNHHHHGGMGRGHGETNRSDQNAISPAFTTFSPTGTSTGGGNEMMRMTSPDPSIIAVHGSVMTNFPQPRGGAGAGKYEAKQGGVSGEDWFKISSNIRNQKKDSVSTQGNNGNTVPQTPIDEQAVPRTPIEEKTKNMVLKEDKDDEEDCANDKAEKKTQPEQVREKKEKEKPVYMNDRVIAIDFDDVCNQNMATIIKQHNAIYGSDLTLDDLQTYVLWQNRGWGTPAEVARKIQNINKTLLPLTSPIPGFAEGLKKIHELGHPIHIVTSRSAAEKQEVVEWLSKYGITIGDEPNDIIRQIHFTGTYGDVYQDIEYTDDKQVERELNEKLRVMWRDGVGKGKGGLGKLKILQNINASLFIDDNHTNLEPILNSNSVSPSLLSGNYQCDCLLFGEYGWNKFKSGVTTQVELMDYEERISKALQLPLVDIELGKDQRLFRVKDWDELVEWVKEWDREVVDAVCYDT